MTDSPPPKKSPSPPRRSRSRSRSPPPRRDRDNYRERDERERDSYRDRRGGNGGGSRGGGREWRGGRDWDRDRGDRRDDYRNRGDRRDDYRGRGRGRSGGGGGGGRRDRDSMADDYPYRRRPGQNQGRRDAEIALDRDDEPRRNDRYDRNDRYNRTGRNDRDDDRYRGDRFYSDRERDSRRVDGERDDGPRRRRDEEKDEDEDVHLPPSEPRPSKPKKTPGFKWKDEPPRNKSSISNTKSRPPTTTDTSSGLTFTGPSKPKAKDVAPKNATAIPKAGGGQEEMIIVHVNDRLGTKAAIPCFASDRIKEFKIMVAARIGREPHEILLKRQGERPFKDQLTLEDYGVSNGVQIDLEVDTGD